MRTAIFRTGLAALALLSLGACATHPAPPPPAPASATAPAEQRQAVTLLISIDGFRPDYLERGVTPNLNALAKAGASSEMRPSFPSKTFPNHWSIVTGLRPDRHGIVSNGFEDPARKEAFTMASDDPFWWNAAEPIWVTAEKAGIRTATMFWPGANVAWGGVRQKSWPYDVEGGTRPQDWQQFNGAVTDTQRVNAVLDWLRRPADIRPKFLTLYFEGVDHAGHSYGPGDQRTTDAVAAVDRHIGELVQALAVMGQPVNYVIVADHGMAATSSDRVIPLDTILPPGDARIVEAGPFASLVPAQGKEDAVAAALLKPHDHMQCWRRENIPARFAYGKNPRIPPFFCLAEDGWLANASAPRSAFTGGNHGYDNDAPDMRALFIASGPAFARGVKLPTFDNVDVEPLLRDLIGLPAGSGLDGDDKPFRGVLRK